jgi:hypothetical protein
VRKTRTEVQETQIEDQETQTEDRKTETEDQDTQTEDSLIPSPPVPAQPRPNLFMVSGWHTIIATELQNILDNTSPMCGTYDAHYHIKTARSMFEELTDFHETLLQENMELKAKLENSSLVASLDGLGECLGYDVDETLVDETTPQRVICLES